MEVSIISYKYKSSGFPKGLKQGFRGHHRAKYTKETCSAPSPCLVNGNNSAFNPFYILSYSEIFFWEKIIYLLLKCLENTIQR